MYCSWRRSIFLSIYSMTCGKGEWGGNSEVWHFMENGGRGSKILKKCATSSGLLQFPNTVTTNFYKTSLTWEIDHYWYEKLPHRNSGLKNLEKSGRVATLHPLRTIPRELSHYTDIRKKNIYTRKVLKECCSGKNFSLLL